LGHLAGCSAGLQTFFSPATTPAPTSAAAPPAATRFLALAVEWRRTFTGRGLGQLLLVGRFDSFVRRNGPPNAAELFAGQHHDGRGAPRRPGRLPVARRIGLAGAERAAARSGRNFLDRATTATPAATLADARTLGLLVRDVRPGHVELFFGHAPAGSRR